MYGVTPAAIIQWRATYGKTVVLGKNGNRAIALRVLGGIGHAYGNSVTMPFEKQFYSGGANSMRGWQARDVGPGYAKTNRSFSIPSQTGDVKLEADLEFRSKLFWKLEGALFAECGNVWSLQYDDPENRFNIHDFYYGTRNFTGNRLHKAYGKNYDINSASNPVVCDYFLEKGDYLKLDMVTLGYTFRPNNWRFLDRVRVYATMKNVFTLTKFSGVDPSNYQVNGLTPGGQGSRTYFPSTRQFIAGLQIDF